MAKKNHTLTVQDLWKLEWLGEPSLAPDGASAVASLTRHSMEENHARSALWLLSTLGGEPRALTHCGDKDGQPQWSPHRDGRGERIAFLARREQEGKKDETPQLYAIAPDGGEATRLASVATGVEGFRWFPDGRRIAFVSWVWPDAKGHKAQARRHQAFEARKETGYVTSESQYRYWDHTLPMGRVAHLHVLDTDSGRFRDLFEGSAYELERAEPDADSFDISPDGRRVVFAFDPQADKRLDNPMQLVEMELRSGRCTVLATDREWTMTAPRYSPDGGRVAFIAANQGRKHTMPQQLAVWDRETGAWQVESAAWDHEVEAPLRWEEDGQALLFAAQQRGRRHLWRFDLPDRRAEVVVEGGWVHGFDKRAGTLVTLADSALYPARLEAHWAGDGSRRIERFNDELMAGLDLGRREELVITGAAAEGDEGDPVQVWLTYPPGFDGAVGGQRPGRREAGAAARERRRWPILHVVHGGPHAAAADTWHYRWNAQAFAAQGYVVAEVNYHGSSGFGYAFLDSITHRWGQLESQDLEAATDQLLRRPWADPKRVFLSGGSYGGYLAAWMNGHAKTGRYAAYVCHAGCFDWRAMFADDAHTWHAKELGAWYWDAPERIDAQSPHAAAAAMRTPTLVIHGALDYRVPDAQGLAYYNTLKALQVEARLLWFPDENHWVLKPRNSQLWYGEFFAWLARHDPGRQASRRRR